MRCVFVIKRSLCTDVQGHDVRPSREHIHILFLQVLSCLRRRAAVLNAGNHLLAQSVFFVILADGRNSFLFTFRQLGFGQIFLGVVGNLQITVGGKLSCKIWIVGQENWSATLSLAGEVSGVLGEAVVHDLRSAIGINDLAVTKPLFKRWRRHGAQAKLSGINGVLSNQDCVVLRGCLVFYQVAVKPSLLNAALPLAGSIRRVIAFGVFDDVQRVCAGVIQVS